MIYTVTTERDSQGNCLIVNHAGFKTRYGTEIGVAKALEIDSGELYHQLTKRQGMTFVIKKDGRHWYA
jgi:hypothetical protein